MGETSKKELVERLMDEAVERWGEDEAESIRSALETIAEAIWDLGRLRLELEDEPAARVDLRFEAGEG